MKIKLQTSAVIKALETKLAELTAKHKELTKQETTSKTTLEKFKKNISKHIGGFELSKTEYRDYNNTCTLSFEKVISKEEYESLIGPQPDELRYSLRSSKREIEEIEKNIRLLHMSADETVPASLLQNITQYL